MKSGYTQASSALTTQHASSPSVLVQKHKAFLDARMGQLAKWVTNGLRPEALVRFLLADMSTNEKLRACSQESVYLGLLACAVVGLEPGSLKSECWLVPFKNQATFIAGYRGYIKQARRSRMVIGFTANVVHENDVFDLDLGTANTLVHKPALRDRGPVQGAYAIATLTGGHHEIEYIDREDLDHVRQIAESRGKSPAWSEWPEQMARKTPIRRLAKRLPMGTDFYLTLALEQAHDEGRDQKAVLDVETDGEATRAEDAAARAPKVERPLTDEEKAEIEREEASDA